MAEAEVKGTNEGLAIGIDLGTTFSCVAIVRHGKVDFIANEQGKVTTPSYVAFNEHERLIGGAAKAGLAKNSENTIFDAKRLIGRKFSDPIVQKDMKQWPFKVVDVNGMPKVEVKYMNEVKRFSAEEISAMILGKMKENAEWRLGEKVSNAVITVPAYFNDLQRKATKDAATIAGLNVTRMINEPTAAAIAYGLFIDTEKAKNVLVYDLGGGTFDVSILNICEDDFKVKAVGGETHLGGEDFDNRMMVMLIEKFKLKHNIDISGNNRALRKLRTECEKAKRALSSSKCETIEIDSLADGIDFSEDVTRDKFEAICDDLFRLTIKAVEGVLKDADLKSENIDTIVLVGGSTRIPKIEEIIQEKFPGKEICKTIDADKAVAHGAAVLAAILHGGATAEMKKMKLVEVTPLTLGVGILESRTSGVHIMVMAPAIKRNTPIPVSQTYVSKTVFDSQTAVRIPIIQGECRLAADNFEIGNMTIAGIPPAPAGVEKVVITFSIDDNGMLTVTASSQSNPKASGQLVIKNVCGSLTKTEIDQMVAAEETYRKEDRKVKQCKTARMELENYCEEIMNKFGSKKSFIREKCNETLAWLNSCSRPSLAQFRQWKDELKSLTQVDKKAKLENGLAVDDDDIEIIEPHGNDVIEIDD